MQSVFDLIGRLFIGTPVVALAAAFSWGVLSILLSPCHLASIPLSVGCIAGGGRRSTASLLRMSSLFATGLVATVLAVGLVTVEAGRLAGDIGRTGFAIAGFVLVLFGLVIAGVIRLPALPAASAGLKRRDPIGIVLAGMAIGLVLGPCTFAFMAPLLAVTVSLAPPGGLPRELLLVSFGIGHFAAVTFAGASFGIVSRLLGWNERSRILVTAKAVCGALVVLAGLYVIRLHA